MSFLGTKKAKPLISVCIANYNGRGILYDCVQSVFAQKGIFDLEVLVYDDASTDGSGELISTQFPEIVLIAGKTNVGFCLANNRMVLKARGEYVLLLNNDAELLDGALQELLNGADRLGRPAILTLPQYDYASGVLVDRGCMLDHFYNPVPNLDPYRRDVAMVIGACLWIDRNLWDKLGGFPEWFGSIAEDMYLCCQARVSGHAVQVMPGSGYRHKQGASFGGNKTQHGKLNTTFRRRAMSERNKTYVMFISTPTIVLWVIAPLHLVLLHIEGIVLTLLKWKVDYWKNIYGSIVPALWLRRNLILELRKKNVENWDTTIQNYCSVFNFMPRKLILLIRYGLPSVK